MNHWFQINPGHISEEAGIEGTSAGGFLNEPEIHGGAER